MHTLKLDRSGSRQVQTTRCRDMRVAERGVGDGADEEAEAQEQRDHTEKKGVYKETAKTLDLQAKASLISRRRRGSKRRRKRLGSNWLKRCWT